MVARSRQKRATGEAERAPSSAPIACAVSTSVLRRSCHAGEGRGLYGHAVQRSISRYLRRYFGFLLLCVPQGRIHNNCSYRATQ